MFAVEVTDNVFVMESGEDLKLGMKLLALLLRHLEVADFFSADDHAIGLAAHLADDAEGTVACMTRDESCD